MKKSFKKQVKKSLVAEVRPNEYEFVNTLIDILDECEGKENAISNERLIERLEARHSKIFSPTHIRRYINYIRINHCILDLIANKFGYYIATTDEEVAAYKAALKHRAAAILCLAKSYEV